MINIVTLVFITAALYWAQAVLIPMALAILLAFVLHPLVDLLRRTGLSRIPTILAVVFLVFTCLGGFGWVLSTQFLSLASDLPQYQDNIKKKIASLRTVGQGGILEKVQKTVKEVTSEINKDQDTAASRTPVPVVIEAPSVLSHLPSFLELLAHGALVLVLVIFILIERGDLLNRLIRLIGYDHLTRTTHALQDAGERISRYLLMQSVINGSYGAAMGLMLFFIGVPYAALWGFLAAVLRFIPYLGTALGALLPIAMSLATFAGWLQPLLFIGFIVVLELFASNVLEPWLYGRSAGVSQVALLVAMAFWTWLWGPIGLFLSTPLTVCLGVLGKYVPQLEFLGVLMSDETAVEVKTSYYQRLVAKDQDEAVEIVEAYLETHAPIDLYDEVLVPALHYAEQDQQSGRITVDEAQGVYQATRKIIEGLTLQHPERCSLTTAVAEALPGEAALYANVAILACPAQDEADELALYMLQQLLDPRRYEVELISPTLLTAEIVSLVEERNLDIICIGTILPGGLAEARYLCKRLRTRLPALQILVGRWGSSKNISEQVQLLHADGANEVGMTLRETRDQIMRVAQLLSTLTSQPTSPVPHA